MYKTIDKAVIAAASSLWFFCAAGSLPVSHALAEASSSANSYSVSRRTIHQAASEDVSRAIHETTPKGVGRTIHETTPAGIARTTRQTVPEDELAPDARVEAAVRWAISIAEDSRHGYSQGAENSDASHPYTGSREGPDYDCSSLVYHAFDAAGFGIIRAWRENPAFYDRYGGGQKTGDADTIFSDLQKVGGFSSYEWADVHRSLVRGDILCDPERHVAIYIGGGKTVEARGVNNPRGGDWATGDQGGEIDFYDAHGRGWTHVYRYTG